MKLVFLVFFSLVKTNKSGQIFSNWILQLLLVLLKWNFNFQWIVQVFSFNCFFLFIFNISMSCSVSPVFCLILVWMNEWMIADSNSTWDWHIICIFSYNVFYLLCARISICSSSSEFRHITKSHLATFSPLPFPTTHSGWQKQTFFVSYLLAIYPVLKHNKFQRFFSSSLLSRNKRKKFASELKLVCLVCKYAVMWFTQTRTQFWPAMLYRPILLVLVNCI